VFKEAPPIAGGREFLKSEGKLEEGSFPNSQNNFQGRYAMRHEWTGPIECDNPVRGRWGGPPDGQQQIQPKPATDLAFVTRGKTTLANVVVQDIPEIGIVAAKAAPAPKDPVEDPKETAQPPKQDGKQSSKGKGCASGGESGATWWLLAALGLLFFRRPTRDARVLVTGAALVGMVFLPRVASAFCGFYVAGSGDELTNNATQVVMMRDGTKTVLSMQNNYQGPPSDFAMVVPVPVVLQEDNVKILPNDVFKRVDRLAAPRLVEYWEKDPCAPEPRYERRMAAGAMPTTAMPRKSRKKADLGVTVEAQFTVGEYEIVILSAKYSSGLEDWLKRENYSIPEGAEKYLRPYVQGGSKFFVAKVDVKKVKFKDNQAMLSPLRFHYESKEFQLPVRLGLMNAKGKQDLLVHILAKSRYEVANYPNVTIPTNLDVSNDIRDRFAEFYAALFDKTLEKHPNAVVTEYSWASSTCDPCPTPPLSAQDIMTLGYDIIGPSAGTANKPTRPMRGRRFMGPPSLTLTRLHARYDASNLGEDLVFKEAEGIVGGREHRNAEGKLEESASPSSYNNFQGRYAIRHEWEGPISCDKPIRGRWGGPPSGQQATPKAATDLAFATRGAMTLASAVPQGIPELGIASAPKVAEEKDEQPEEKTQETPDKPATEKSSGKGKGCSTSSSNSLSLWLGFLVAVLLFRRQRVTDKCRTRKWCHPKRRRKNEA
jgi:MYXO-CTERM domain-containing protein